MNTVEKISFAIIMHGPLKGQKVFCVEFTLDSNQATAFFFEGQQKMCCPGGFGDVLPVEVAPEELGFLPK